MLKWKSREDKRMTKTNKVTWKEACFLFVGITVGISLGLVWSVILK